jgi:hypothetical protein
MERLIPAVMTNIWMISIWTAKLPLKIKMFLWQVCNGKVQSVEQIAKGPTQCKLCGQVESIEHIFVQCALVTEICFFHMIFYRNCLNLKFWYNAL